MTDFANMSAVLSSRSQPSIRILTGPSKVAEFPCVVAEFPLPAVNSVPVEQFRAGVRRMAPDGQLKLALPETGLLTFADAGLAAVLAFHNVRSPMDVPSEATLIDQRTGRIVLGYYNPKAAFAAMQAGLQLSHAVFADLAGQYAEPRATAEQFQGWVATIRALQPDYMQRAFLTAARARGIPHYSPAAGSRNLTIGQGRNSYFFFESASQGSSIPGQRLTRNKFHSNTLVRELGFPGVRHGIAGDPESAARLAQEIGFPVVLKPLDGSHGEGVRIGLATPSEVKEAFQTSAVLSRGSALVEEFIPGDAYRLTVFDGKLMRANRQVPPAVMGNGQDTIAQLIEIDNRGRSPAEIATGLLFLLKIDDDMLEVLKSQGFGPNDCPKPGEPVALRRNSNLFTGARLEGMTSKIHPDNIAMAESLARNVYLDAVGIDFVTPDIGVPWHKIRCAVIEINSHPGMGDVVAQRVIAHRFPEGTDGRIPSFLLIGGSFASLEKIAAAAKALGLNAGITDEQITRFGAEQRFFRKASLSERVLSLVLEPTCDVLAVSCGMAALTADGFPQTRFDLALVDAETPLSPDDRQLLARGAATVKYGVTAAGALKYVREQLRRTART